MNTAKEPLNEAFLAYLADCDHLPYGVGIVKKDAFSTIIQANSAFYQLLGHTKEQMESLYQNRIVDILIDNVYHQIEETPPDGDFDLEWDLRIRAADDTIHWIHDFAHYSAQWDVFFVILTDVTDKLLVPGSNLSYKAFQTKQEVLTYLAKYTSEHIIVTDVVTDEVVYMNPMAMKLLGFQHESDWVGKPYYEVAFGSPPNIPDSYYKPVGEDEFTVDECYNDFHKMYLYIKSKIITIPALKRKMRLHIISDITPKKRLEYKIALHKTLHRCMDTLFTSATTNSRQDDVYNAVLEQIKGYYQGDRAFFYKFKGKSHEVDNFYEVFSHGVKKVEHALPLMVSDSQMAWMQQLSDLDGNQNQGAFDSLDAEQRASLARIHSQYEIKDFSCVTVTNAEKDIVAFMGVTNPKMYEGNKELMELLSRFICMFIEHQQDLEVKEEALTLEAVSKAALIETCTKNFQSLGHAKDKINDTLDGLCSHYDADYALVLTHNKENGSYGVSYVGGQTIPAVESFANQPSHAMKQWVDIFHKHSQFVTDADIQESAIKEMLRQRFGIHNFIVSPLGYANDTLTGLLFVINYKFMNRAHFMVHVVAKNISDYLDRIQMQEKNQMEPATRLANKVTTQTYISKLLEDGATGSLFVLDIDNFKRLNDTLGHHVGDQALVDFAVTLKNVFRTTDIIGRVGGDEFMVFSPGLVLDSLIETKANQLLAQCKRRYEKDGLTVEISASVGICRVDQRCKTFQPLYENADYALYISKKSGKNRYHLYSAAEYLVDNSATDDLRFYPNVVSTLKSAIEGHRFVVHYQPLYHVPAKAFTQAEALVRIAKPDGTLIYPNDFIQVAESTGLVVEMTYQILEQVCCDFRKLLDQDTTVTAISVNVPYLQFTDPNMENRFLKILETYQISPSQIKLEITERTIISDMDLMLKKMASLTEKGFDFELDDFGTDYSNLGMCITLPLDMIKLDRSLLLAASATDTGRHFFGHILSGLHETGRHTIMEGVETQEQLDWAKSCGCEYIQGFYFSKPVEFDSFTKIL